MQRSYSVLESQSIYDVCLNTYGTLSLLGKLMKDNGISDTNVVFETGDTVVWDDDRVFDVLVLRNQKIYVTSYNGNSINEGDVLFVDENSSTVQVNVFITEGDDPEYFKQET